MTIAVAATFPWGLLRKVVTSMPGGSIPGGVILATDSRWTYGDRPPEDVGQKLWKLAPERGIGAIFAGDVRAAEEALDLAEQRLKSITQTSPSTVAPVISNALLDTYEAHSRKRDSVHPLYVLVGMANIRGEGILIKYNYANDFVPVFVVGTEAIGTPSACRKFRDKLPDIDAALLPRNGGSWSLDIDEWALHLVANIFYAVIEPGDEPTVGGGIQIATISPKGWNELAIDRTPNPDDPAAWEQISADTDKLKKWRQQFNVPPRADGGFDFGMVSLVEKSAPVVTGQA